MINANALQIPLADKSVQMCVTSPPYWGLRDYGTAEWVGGDEGCDHADDVALAERLRQKKSMIAVGKKIDGSTRTRIHDEQIGNQWQYRNNCPKCGAQRIDAQLGLEQSPEEYVENMVEVFREVWRVLRDDGTVWLNLGDSYCGSTSETISKRENSPIAKGTVINQEMRAGRGNRTKAMIGAGLKPKDLVGIPWRVAFALQADGWVLRSEIIWFKPNPMPESVTDRPTKAHEQIFLLSKSRYTGKGFPARRWGDSDARWMGLLIETEGSFICRKYTYKRKRPQHAAGITVANTDLSLLEEARRITGCGAILEREGTNLPIYYLQWTTKEAAHIAWEIYPWLFKKKRQAKAIMYLESRRDNKNKGKKPDIFRKEGRHYHLTDKELALRERIFETVKSLNQYEEVDDTWIPEPNEGKWVPYKYYYDNEAIREPSKDWGPRNRDNEKRYSDGLMPNGQPHTGLRDNDFSERGRNKRTVWTVTTKPYSGAHFATFPPDLIEPCIKAGSSKKGNCPECGNPWERVVEKPTPPKEVFANSRREEKLGQRDFSSAGRLGGSGQKYQNWLNENPSKTTGWQPTCDHDLKPVPAIVFDPFFGSGTTGLVARNLGRIGVGIDLSFEYLRLAKDRLGITALDEWENGKKAESNLEGLPMFQNNDKNNT